MNDPRDGCCTCWQGHPPCNFCTSHSECTVCGKSYWDQPQQPLGLCDECIGDADAQVADGEITCTQTGVSLPSYEGLCLAIVGGRLAIMHTWFTTEGRRWDLVHFGSMLNPTEIEKYMNTKGKE